jgi:hypothetical protein
MSIFTASLEPHSQELVGSYLERPCSDLESTEQWIHSRNTRNVILNVLVLSCGLFSGTSLISSHKLRRALHAGKVDFTE